MKVTETLFCSSFSIQILAISAEILYVYGWYEERKYESDYVSAVTFSSLPLNIYGAHRFTWGGDGRYLSFRNCYINDDFSYKLVMFICSSLKSWKVFFALKKVSVMPGLLLKFWKPLHEQVLFPIVFSYQTLFLRWSKMNRLVQLILCENKKVVEN